MKDKDDNIVFFKLLLLLSNWCLVTLTPPEVMLTSQMQGKPRMCRMRYELVPETHLLRLLAYEALESRHEQHRADIKVSGFGCLSCACSILGVLGSLKKRWRVVLICPNGALVCPSMVFLLGAWASKNALCHCCLISVCFGGVLPQCLGCMSQLFLGGVEVRWHAHIPSHYSQVLNQFELCIRTPSTRCWQTRETSTRTRWTAIEAWLPHLCSLDSSLVMAQIGSAKRGCGLD